MLYELPLDQPYYSKSIIDLEKNIRLKDELSQIEDFESRLTYYNDNIQSLSCFSMAGKIDFEWGNPDQKIKIYCGCKSCRKEAEFNPDNEKLFFTLRKKEVARIVKGVTEANTYRDKLQFIFNTPGYYPNYSPLVFDNIPYDYNKDAGNQMHDTLPAIDLSAKTAEEIIVYNEFIIAHFDAQYRSSKGFSNYYVCFDFEKENLKLTETLRKSKDQITLLNYCKRSIEIYFNYPDSINPKPERNEEVRKINTQLKSFGWLGDNLFAKMILGIEIDLNSKLLDENELLRYTHISEIVKFYKHILYSIEKLNEASKFGVLLPLQKTLSSLAIDNPVYNKWVKLYYKKVNTATQFLEKSVFISDEIKRIEDEYLQPLEVTVSGPWKVTKLFDENHKKSAYNWLKSGQDFEIARIINNARQQYIEQNKMVNPHFNEILYTGQLAEFEKGLIYSLQTGVAMLMYNKFLKQQQNENTLAPQGEGNEVLPNDFVDNYLSAYKKAFNSIEDYIIASNSIRSFFISGKSDLNKTVFVKNGNIRNIAFAMGEIWRSQKNEVITYEYLLLYKQLFSIFKDQTLNRKNLFSNNLYKYSLSKT